MTCWRAIGQRLSLSKLEHSHELGITGDANPPCFRISRNEVEFEHSLSVSLATAGIRTRTSRFTDESDATMAIEH